MANMTFKTNILPSSDLEYSLGSSEKRWKINDLAGGPIEYIVGTQTKATGSWTGVTKDSTLVTGKVIAYKLPFAGSGNASLTLTYTDPLEGEDTTSGAIPVYLANTRVTTHYAAGTVIIMAFDGSNWRSTDYWNSNSRDAGYGKISLEQSDETSALITNTTQLAAHTYNETMTLAAGNKWVQFAGTNSGSNNADVLTVAHSLSGVTAGNYGDSSAQTPGYGATFNVPYISVDAAGHVTGISSHTVKIPASDNTWRGIQDNLTSDSATDSLSAKQGKALANGSARDDTKLPLAGGTMTGAIKRYYSATSTDPAIAVAANNQDATALWMGHGTAAGNPSGNYYKFLYKGTGSSPNNYFQLIAGVASSSEVVAMQVNEQGNVSFTNTVAASISGTAAKATADGDGNTITSTYVKKSGDTMTGVLTMKGSMYNDAFDGALNMNNSDIYGANSIYTADSADGAAEGLHFYRDSTHVDTLWISGGNIYFVPNRAIGTNTTAANSQKVGRFTANPTTGQVVITDGTAGGIKSSGYTIAKSVPSDAVFTDTKVTQTNQTGANDYRILLSGSANDTTATEGANKSTNLRFNPSTKVFSVGGDISATGDLTLTGNANLNSETYAESITAGSLLVNGAANFVNIPTAPTPVATSNDTSIATTAFVMNAFTANDAMVFKGVINANSGLPADHKQGWTYRVGTAGTYANKVCEVGDIIICVTEGTSANNDHWAVIQNNVDGAVYRGTNAFTDANIIVADSTAGKVKSSGKTITTTAPSSSAADTTIPTSKAVWSAVTAGLGTLDVSSVGGTGKYISAISQTDGKISATATSTSVSNSWTAGTTAGPKIATTVNGVAGTAVAIPIASSTASGVVTTDSQTFAGDKTFNSDNFLIKASTIRFQNKAGSTQQAKQGSDNSTLHPYVTSILIGDNREITLDEYQGAGLAIHSNKGLFLHTTATPIQIYDPTKTYTVGSLVWYSSNYYKCKNAITTAQEWTAENWDNVSSSNGVIKTDATTFVPLTTNTSSLGTNTIRWKALYIGTTDSYGSATEPIYWSSGVPTKGDKYAGGTAVTLNGTSAAKSTASFYAPTGAGTSGQLLKSNGSGAPTWFTPSYVTSSGVTSITPGNGLLNGTGTSAITSTGTLNLNYGSSASAVATTAAAGTANTVSRSDHVHSISVVNNNINLSRNTETTIATIAGTAIKIKLPASDNTDTKQNIILATTSKAFVTGVTTTPTSSAQALTGVADTGVYLTATAGELSAVRHSFNSNGTEKAYITFNTTTNALDFIFA